MSDLKHKTPDELRAEIRYIQAKRAKLEALWKDKEQAAEHILDEARARAQVLLDEVNRLRSSWYGQGQREAWARIYLAQKT